jgi:hypothetical protein
MKTWLKDRGLTLALLFLVAVSLVEQAAAGSGHENDELRSTPNGWSI